jgi:cell division protein FtsL
MLKQKQKKDKLEKRLGWAAGALGLLITAAGLAYLVTINDISVKGFALADLKSRKSDLAKENQDLELEIMRLTAYSRISRRAGELDLVRVDKVNYLSAVPAAVAKR